MARLALFLALLALPLAAHAQLSLDVGIASTGSGEPYQELSASGRQSVGGPFFIASRLSLTRALYSVDYDLLPGGPPPPPYAQRAFSLAVVGGVVRDLGPLAVQGALGVVHADIAQAYGPDVTRLGLAGEAGVSDLRLLPSLSLGASAYVTTTTSYTWRGLRVGARVDL